MKAFLQQNKWCCFSVFLSHFCQCLQLALISASLGSNFWLGVSPTNGLWNDGSTISSTDFPSLAASSDCGGMISGVDGTVSPVDDCTQPMKVLCKSKCHNRCYCVESSALALPTVGMWSFFTILSDHSKLYFELDNCNLFFINLSTVWKALRVILL